MLAAAVVAVVALPVLAREGAFQAQIDAANGGWRDGLVQSNGDLDVTPAFGASVSGTVSIFNSGWSTVQVVGVSLVGKGLTFDHATVGETHVEGDTVHPGGRLLTPQAPVALMPRHSLELTLFLTITDCRDVAAAGERATIRISSWRGGQSASVALPTVRHEPGGWTVTTPSDPNGISSMRYLADAVCHVNTGG